jgi:hypothetical protein
MKKNFALFVFNLIKIIFFTNVSKYVNYVREKLVKKRHRLSPIQRPPFGLWVCLRNNGFYVEFICLKV